MAADRLSKAEFYAKIGDLDEERLRKALWNVYWRGSARVRERIEDQIAPEAPKPKTSDGPPAPERVLRDVREFCALAYKGAFIGAPCKGMNPKRRSQWRHEFRRHHKAADEAMAAGSDAGTEAFEAIIALAVHCGTYETFTSQEPLETAGFVVSDAVERLWRNTLERHGFARFAERSAGQLIAWEAEHGWTVSGYGPIAQRERRLAEVLALLLPGIDQWQTYARHYLDALDQAPPVEPRILAASFDIGERDRARRSETLDAWHSMLLERLVDGEESSLLDRIAEHPALGGPAHDHFRAHLARTRGDLTEARRLASACLDALPGKPEYLEFATSIDAEIPEGARLVMEMRRDRGAC